MTEEQVEQLLTEYDCQFVEEKIIVVQDSKPYQEGKIQNLAAYLISAVKNNYQAAKPKLQLVNMQDARLELELSDLKRQAELIRNDYKAYRESIIHETIAALPLATKEKFMEEFFGFAEPVVHTILQLQRNKYTRETVLESPQLQALLRKFALRELDIFGLSSLEEFVASTDESKREAWQKLKSYDPDHALLHFKE